MKNINEIKNEFLSVSICEIMEIINKYACDERKGVQTLVSSYRKKHEAYIKEQQRLEEISQFEKKYYDLGFSFIAGIDEVGRGPLAGPVVAAAVILPKGFKHEGINDSKKLTHEKRKVLAEIIKDNALAWSIGIVGPEIIDEINILNATKIAMLEAIQKLNTKPDFLLVDALSLDIGIKQVAITKGDERSISIAAASIVAKVHRDELMGAYSEVFAEYGFENNKGYGSSRHIEAIKTYGICPLHRKTFVGNLV